MRSTQIAQASFSAVVSLEGATRFSPILDRLVDRLGFGWDLEASRTCDGASLLMVSAAADEVDVTLTVTEVPNGFMLEELAADRLSLIGTCQTLDQVTSLVTRHVFQVPVRLGLTNSDHSVAA